MFNSCALLSLELLGGEEIKFKVEEIVILKFIFKTLNIEQVTLIENCSFNFLFTPVWKTCNPILNGLLIQKT